MMHGFELYVVPDEPASEPVRAAEAERVGRRIDALLAVTEVHRMCGEHRWIDALPVSSRPPKDAPIRVLVGYLVRRWWWGIRGRTERARDSLGRFTALGAPIEADEEEDARVEFQQLRKTIEDVDERLPPVVAPPRSGRRRD